MSGASERANGRASGLVLTSLFLVDPDHRAVDPGFESDFPLHRFFLLLNFFLSISFQTQSFFIIATYLISFFRLGTMVQSNQESRHKYWATRSSVCLFACTAHSPTCCALLASLTRSATLSHSFAHSLTHSLPSSWERKELDAGISGCSGP